ncbi:MAG: M56 family metallopeptidase [Bacteroidota bacterium]
MKLIENILAYEIINALGWTILHALWQGILLAIVIGLLMIFLNKSSAQLRYLVASTALVAMFFISIVTFFSLIPEHIKDKKATTIEYSNITPISVIIADIERGKGNIQDVKTAFVAYFNNHLPLIVGLWIMGVLALTLKLLGGLAYVQRIKTYNVKKVENYWQERVSIIAEKLSIKRTVSLFESALVKVPIVIGHLKPIVLLPIGTFTGLSPDQLEAILAHELAHIARRDYIVNIIQSLIEVLFFYHPGIWWISAIIREEREHCCDDIAVALNKDSLTFAKALTELQEINWQIPSAALAVKGNKGKLLTRIERLLNHRSTGSTFKDGFITAIILIITTISFSFTFNKVYYVKEERLVNVEAPITESNVRQEDTLSTHKQIVEKLPSSTLGNQINDTTKIDLNGNRISFTLEDGRYVFARIGDDEEILALFVEGLKIPVSEYGAYEAVINEVKDRILEIKKEKNRLEEEKEKMQAMLIEQENMMRKQRDAMQKEIEMVKVQEMAQRNNEKELQLELKKIELAKKQRALEIEHMLGVIKKQEKVDDLDPIAMQQMLLEIEQKKLEIESLDIEALRKAEQISRSNRPRVERSRVIRERLNVDRKMLMQEREKLNQEMVKATKESKKHNEYRLLLLNELVKDGFIESVDDKIKFQIRDNKMFINGKKQADKYFKKYIKLMEDYSGETIERGHVFTYENE